MGPEFDDLKIIFNHEKKNNNKIFYFNWKKIVEMHRHLPLKKYIKLNI